jgi:hypothetical protein
VIVQVELGVFAPHTMLSQFPTVIAPENDDGILVQTICFQALQQATDLCIDV